MNLAETASAWAKERREAHLAEFKELLAIPSISTLSEHKADVEKTARWMAARLERLQLDHVEIFPTKGHPIVYGEWARAAGKPTMLVYGHYDVQPADPLDEWESPPFEPTVRGENIYARGASDMKGQILAQILAVESLCAHAPLPFNIKYLIEGEEEIGSVNLPAFAARHKDMLACDFVLNCDGGIHAPDAPSIVYALRGLAYFEIHVTGPKKDLHSGLFGGTILNPAQALCELIAGMHDADGRVTLPGFYDKVRPLDQAERDALSKIPHSNADWLEITGAPALWGEKGYTTVERYGARPTLEVNGMLSGFTGEGSKTVLPARAMAKISTRLVADQEPADIAAQLRAYLKTRAPEGIQWEVRELTHGPGAIMDRNSPFMQKAMAALENVFGVKPFFERMGGSVPIVGHMQKELGVDSIMMGFALPTDGIHGPNEKQHLPTWYRGIESYIQFMASL